MRNSIKGLFIAASVSAFILSCTEEKRTGGNVVVSGKLEKSSGDTVYLVNVSQQPFVVVDSAVTGDDGSFEFRPTISFKGFYNIEVGRGAEQFATIILEPKDSVQFTGNAENLGYSWTCTGSEDTKHFGEFSKYMSEYENNRRPLMQKLDSLQRSFQIQVSMMQDTNEIRKLEKEVIEPMFNSSQERLMSMATEAENWIKGFIDQHPGSFANIPALRLLDPFENFPYWEKTINALEEKYKTAPNVVLLRDLVEKEKPLCKGQVAPEIKLKDTKGKDIALSELRGKVVLIDFWASWCAPCRAELPNVVANYKKYHDKGFEIYSVSLDNNKQAWEDAITKDGLTWPYHVSDLMQWQSSVVPLYRIQGIPKTYLIDREGKIIDKDLRGPDLGKKLEEVFTSSVQ